MSYQVSKMRLTLKRILQALFLAVLFSFSTLAMFRTLAASTNTTATIGRLTSVEQGDSRWIKTFVGLWPDRSLRSVVDEEGNTLAGILPLMDDNVIDENSVFFEGVLSKTTTTTTTIKPHTTLDDIFISVKTTKNFHASRLDVIIKTWFTLAREQVYIVIILNNIKSLPFCADFQGRTFLPLTTYVRRGFFFKFKLAALFHISKLFPY